MISRLRQSAKARACGRVLLWFAVAYCVVSRCACHVVANACGVSLASASELVTSSDVAVAALLIAILVNTRPQVRGCLTRFRAWLKSVL
jgi:hypothetical protein